MQVVPGLYQFVLLALIAYRLWRLLAEDEILDRPRRWALRLPMTWEAPDVPPPSYREKWGLFLTCPWCAGGWISLATYIGWMFTLGDTPSSISEVFVAIGIWFAISTVVGVIRAQLDPPDET